MITFLSRIYALQLNRNLASSTHFAPPLISFIFKFLFGILWKASCNWSRDQVIRYFTFINFLDIVHTINNNSGMANCLCKPLQEMVTNFNFFSQRAKVFFSSLNGKGAKTWKVNVWNLLTTEEQALPFSGVFLFLASQWISVFTSIALKSSLFGNFVQFFLLWTYRRHLNHFTLFPSLSVLITVMKTFR